MSATTGIEWTDATWNPVTGCTKVSAGCDHCYAETFAERFRGTPGHYFERGFDVQVRPDKLALPLTWRNPKRVFVNSMSDLFHDQVPDEYIAKVWAHMALAPRHTFQLLTKRHGRMRSLIGSERFASQVYMAINEALAWKDKPLRVSDDTIVSALDSFAHGQFTVLPNVWGGVTAENQMWAETRGRALVETPFAVRFLSLEPLLGPIDLLGTIESPGPAIVRTGVQTRPHTADGPAEYDYDDQVDIDWVIVGGESGRGARPMNPDWARSLRDQCTAAGVSFLFKQWGEWVAEDQSPEDIILPGKSTRHWGDDAPGVYKVGKHRAGRELDGRTWDQYPAVAS